MLLSLNFPPVIFEGEIMPIPKEILAVERPKNTIVVMYGKNKNLFAVRNVWAAAMTMDAAFVPKDIPQAPVSLSPVDLKGWGWDSCPL